MRTTRIGRVTYIWQGSSDILRVAVVTKNQGAGVKVTDTNQAGLNVLWARAA